MKHLIGVLALVAVLTGCRPSKPDGPILVGSSSSAFAEAAERAFREKDGAAGFPYEVRVQLVDDYGQKTSAPVVTLFWTASDLEKVNWADFSKYQMANIATVRIDGMRGVIAFAEWCGKYASLTPRLCGQGRRRAEEDWARRLAQTAR